MDLHVLQANINHSARAQDLLMQSMAEWLINIAIVAEPYYVPPRDNWAGDEEGLVALISSGSPPMENKSRGRGFVASHVGDLLVVGVYFSPNRQLAEFEEFLGRLGTFVGSNRSRPVVIAGDFNAKSTAWGSPVTSARGRLVEEWALELGLVLLNRGSVQTCVRHNGGSIVDLSFASPVIGRRISDWRVVEGSETLSDHRYIRFSVCTNSSPSHTQRRATESGEGPRWAVKKLNREDLEEAAIVLGWATPVHSASIDIDEEAMQFRQALTHLCDAAMPRIRYRGPVKRQVYWWSQEIAELRRSCVNARHRYARFRRRRRRPEDAPVRESELYALYTTAKKDLQLSIKAAKVRAREELLAILG
ncbi:uncharacterized protein LOC113493949 [Trichoplusia ni]|uniref:Uncharacterized protein LOC113493949 n=1 Tax=Trichoplusia ni TaxID=7111 RepID=A0A7E5VHS3_TRINI|nr:uncharacterized protein LOC113493949 [Trichoplusia ni]